MSKIYIDATSSESSSEGLYFVMKCNVVDEPPAVGMEIKVPLSSGVEMSIPVDKMELLEENSKRLTIKAQCDDQDDIDFLSGFDLVGEIFVVE